MKIVFIRSNVTATWDESSSSLLELAELHGLELRNGCRSGMCGVCAVRVLAGEVEYLRPTLAEPAPGTALVCKAVPRQRAKPGGKLLLDV